MHGFELQVDFRARPPYVHPSRKPVPLQAHRTSESRTARDFMAQAASDARTGIVEYLYARLGQLNLVKNYHRSKYLCVMSCLLVHGDGAQSFQVSCKTILREASVI